MLTSPISMIIIGQDPQERTLARLQLLSSRKVSVVAESSDFSRGTELIKQFHPHSALIIIDGDHDGPLNQIKRISHECPATAVVCIGRNCPSSVIVKSYRAGATDFLSQPLKPEEIQAVLAKIAARCGENGTHRQEGEVIAIYSSRGGAGVTTLGVNLAAAISRTMKENTVVVDLNLQCGVMPLLFGLDPEYTIADVVRHQDRLDAELLKSFLLRTSENLYCLPAPLRVEEADDVQPDQVQRIISMLRTHFLHVIIDCQHLLDNNTVTALDLADTILLVTLVDVPSVYCTKRVLEVFHKLDFPKGKVKVVINGYDKRSGIPIRKVQEVLDSEIEMALTKDSHAVLASINRGFPLILSQPQSVLAKQYIGLAHRLSRQAGETTRNKKWAGTLLRGMLRAASL